MQKELSRKMHSIFRGKISRIYQNVVADTNLPLDRKGLLFLFCGLLALLLSACTPKTAEKLYSFDCIDESQIRPDAPLAMEYDPVCGCDRRTYTNHGSARVAGVTSFELWAWHSGFRRKDQPACKVEYAPDCRGTRKHCGNAWEASDAGVTAWEEGTCA